MRVAVTAITPAPCTRFGSFALSNVSDCVGCVSRDSSISCRHAILFPYAPVSASRRTRWRGRQIRSRFRKVRKAAPRSRNRGRWWLS